jgi:hypothetical protein
METYTYIRKRSTESVLGTSEHGFPVFQFLRTQARLMFEGTHFHDYSNMQRLLHMLHILYAIIQTDVSLGSVFN